MSEPKYEALYVMARCDRCGSALRLESAGAGGQRICCERFPECPLVVPYDRVTYDLCSRILALEERVRELESAQPRSRPWSSDRHPHLRPIRPK